MLIFFSSIASGNGQLLLTALTIIALTDLKQRSSTPGLQPTTRPRSVQNQAAEEAGKHTYTAGGQADAHSSICVSSGLVCLLVQMELLTYRQSPIVHVQPSPTSLQSWKDWRLLT